MKGEPNSKNGITKARRFPWRTAKKLERSKKSMEMAKGAIKKQFDKKRYNLQRLKVGNNM